MRRTTKIAALAALPVVGLGVATAGAANATTAPTCRVGVTTHTEYKWVPDKVNAGPTQWSLDNAAAGTARTFSWKGAQVAYHRDGAKSTQVTDTTCPAPDPTPATPPADIAVQAPVFSYDPHTCSVTVPFTKGIETRIYGVNGYDQSTPITSDTVVSAGLDGATGTAAQFWIGYTAEPGYTLTGTGTGHVDFYNGDYVADCDTGTVVITSQAQADALMSQGTINQNVDVPQGAAVQLRWVDIKGDLTVEGTLSLASSQIEGSAFVTGPGAGLSLFNDPGNHFYRDLTVNGAGGYYDGSWINTGLGVYSSGQQIDGSLVFTNNTGSRLSLNGSMTVNGSLTYSGNALPYPGGLTVGGLQSVS
jgi:hypothetical protein